MRIIAAVLAIIFILTGCSGTGSSPQPSELEEPDTPISKVDGPDPEPEPEIESAPVYVREISS